GDYSMSPPPARRKNARPRHQVSVKTRYPRILGASPPWPHRTTAWLLDGRAKDTYARLTPTPALIPQKSAPARRPPSLQSSGSTRRRTRDAEGAKETSAMLDLICIGLAVLFFAIAVWFVRGCEALAKED